MNSREELMAFMAQTHEYTTINGKVACLGVCIDCEARVPCTAFGFGVRPGIDSKEFLKFIKDCPEYFL